MFNRFLFYLVCMTTFLGVAAVARAEETKATAPVRVSAWYWLNSAPTEDGEGDFVTMKKLGFTDVLMCWGLDLTGIITRKAETRQAMELAHRAGIGVYLIVWQPHANSLPRTPEFVQIRADGKELIS